MAGAIRSLVNARDLHVVSCSWVDGIIAVVEEIKRAREGVAILLNDVWYLAVVDFGCVSSRMYQIEVWW